MGKFTDAAWKWAEDVVELREPRCLYIRQACQRFIDDFERPDFAFGYDEDEAEWRAGWLEGLPHTKGRWAAKKWTLKLEPWQAFTVCNIFGWKNTNNFHRRFTTVYAELPRKNGKSFLAGGIGLNLFAADGEFGAEVYSGATTERQAWEVFGPARLMAMRTDELREHCGIEVRAKSLVIPGEGAKFEPLIGKPGDGSSPSCAIIDEVHEHDTSEQIETMRTGMGARENPLLFMITTAGVDFGGPCREARGDLIRILSRSVVDEHTFGLIFTIDEGMQWDTVEALEMANPNLDVSVRRELLLADMASARRTPSRQNAYKTKHLNIWVGAQAAWLNMQALERCVDKSLDYTAFAGREAYIAVDLSTKIDITAVAILIPDGGRIVCFMRFYVPSERVYGDSRVDRYLGWVEQGFLTVTDGEVVDIDLIEADVIEMNEFLAVQHVGYDVWQAQQMANHLEDEGIETVAVPFNAKTLSEPMKEVEAEIIDKKFAYDGNDVLTWMMGNVVAKEDRRGNIYPNKERKELKIDGPAALIMARSLMLQPDTTIDQGFVAL